GLRFDLSALFASGSTIARVPLFLLAILLARGLPALVYIRTLGLSRSLIAGILQATTLPFIVAATQIGLQLGIVSPATAPAPPARARGAPPVLLSPLLPPRGARAPPPPPPPAPPPPPPRPPPGPPVRPAKPRPLCRPSDAGAAPPPPLLAQECNGKKQLLDWR